MLFFKINWKTFSKEIPQTENILGWFNEGVFELTFDGKNFKIGDRIVEPPNYWAEIFESMVGNNNSIPAEKETECKELIKT
jgi:hypothetical protein